MITYKDKRKGRTLVYLEGRRIGMIRIVTAGYRYFPKGSDSGGGLFPSLEDCKISLEEGDD